jgi:hypothetical protein
MAWKSRPPHLDHGLDHVVGCAQGQLRVKIHLSTDEMPTAPKSLTFSTTPPYGEFVLRSEQMQN